MAEKEHAAHRGPGLGHAEAVGVRAGRVGDPVWAAERRGGFQRHGLGLQRGERVPEQGPGEHVPVRLATAVHVAGAEAAPDQEPAETPPARLTSFALHQGSSTAQSQHGHMSAEGRHSELYRARGLTSVTEVRCFPGGARRERAGIRALPSWTGSSRWHSCTRLTATSPSGRCFLPR